MKYINTDRSKQEADYARIEPSFDGSLLHVSVKNNNPSINGTIVPMINAKVRLAQPTSVELCDTSCSGVVNEALEVKINVKRGNNGAIATLRAELNRVLDILIADYQLANGVTPPATADFAD